MTKDLWKRSKVVKNKGRFRRRWRKCLIFFKLLRFLFREKKVKKTSKHSKFVKKELKGCIRNLIINVYTLIEREKKDLCKRTEDRIYNRFKFVSKHFRDTTKFIQIAKKVLQLQ